MGAVVVAAPFHIAVVETDWDTVCQVLGTVLGTQGSQGVLVLLLAWDSGRRRSPAERTLQVRRGQEPVMLLVMERQEDNPWEPTAAKNPEGRAERYRGGPGTRGPGIFKDRGRATGASAKPAKALYGLHSGGRAKAERRVASQSPLSVPVSQL